MSCAPWNPAGCAADIAKSVAGDAFTSIAHDFAHAADSATNWLWGQVGSATAIHLGGPGFNLDLGIVLAIAGTVALGLFLVQVISSTLKRDPGGLGRALKGLVVAFIGGGLAIGVTNLLLAAVDSLSNGVVLAATGKSLSGMGHEILPSGAISSATSNPAGMTVLSVATLAAVTIVWAALMVRKVLIVVSAVFAPLAFAGSLSDMTASWTRRWVEAIVALIVSKLVLVIIFVVGLGMLVDGVGQSGTGKTQLATQTVSGLLVLALAGFAPLLALKLVHFSGDQFHHLHSMASTSMAGAQRAVRAPQKVQSMAIGAFGGGAAAAAAGAGAGAGAGTSGRAPGGGQGGGFGGGPGGGSTGGSAASPGPGVEPTGSAGPGPGPSIPAPAFQSASASLPPLDGLPAASAADGGGLGGAPPGGRRGPPPSSPEGAAVKPATAGAGWPIPGPWSAPRTSEGTTG